MTHRTKGPRAAFPEWISAAGAAGVRAYGCLNEATVLDVGWCPNEA